MFSLFVEQIHIHSDVETLFKFVPKDIVPKDYGGNEQSLKDLNGKHNVIRIYYLHLLSDAKQKK